jgi:DNA polymerase-3 subunit delta'
MMILHPETARALEQVAKQPPHAVMLTGKEGSGKFFAAYGLAESLLGARPDAHPYFMLIQPLTKAITIDQVRELQKFVRLKTTGTGQIRRVALIADAHTMTVEAQNALLKLLEEPPDDTVLLMTAQGGTSLKPTIYSRTQRIQVRPISKEQATEHAIKLNKSSESERAFRLSGGDMGLYTALLTESDDHALAGAIKEGKNILTLPVFERLTRVDELGKDKQKLGDLLAALKRVSSAALYQAATKHDTKLQARWQHTLQAVYDCEQQLIGNANTKLMLTDLFINI